MKNLTKPPKSCQIGGLIYCLYETDLLHPTESRWIVADKPDAMHFAFIIRVILICINMQKSILEHFSRYLNSADAKREGNYRCP